jgi:hypothetical protein
VWKNNNFFFALRHTFYFCKNVIMFFISRSFFLFCRSLCINTNLSVLKGRKKLFYYDHEKQILQWMTAVDAFHIYGYDVRFFFSFLIDRCSHSEMRRIFFLVFYDARLFLNVNAGKYEEIFLAYLFPFFFCYDYKSDVAFFLAFIFIITNKSLWIR